MFEQNKIIIKTFSVFLSSTHSYLLTCQFRFKSGETFLLIKSVKPDGACYSDALRVIKFYDSGRSYIAVGE